LANNWCGEAGKKKNDIALQRERRKGGFLPGLLAEKKKEEQSEPIKIRKNRPFMGAMTSERLKKRKKKHEY